MLALRYLYLLALVIWLGGMVVLGAVYLLWMFQRVLFGPVTNEKNRGLPDLTRREFWVLAPVIVFIVWIGVYPNTFLRFLDVPASELMEQVSSRTIAARAVAPEAYGGDEAPDDEAEGLAIGAFGDGAPPAGPGDVAVDAGLGQREGAHVAAIPADSARVEVYTPEPPSGSPGRVTP
jgi:hypothetical protein